MANIKDTAKAYTPKKLTCWICGIKVKDYRTKLCRNCWKRLKPYVTVGFKEGKNNINWKENPSYHAIHAYIRRIKPKEEFCYFCCKKKKLVAANITGRYTKNPEDYVWACSKCHNYYDGTINNLNYQKRKQEVK